MFWWIPIDDPWWSLVVQIALMIALAASMWLFVDRVFRRRTWKRAGFGFWSQFVNWYGWPQLSWNRDGPQLTKFDLDPEESEDLHSWFDPNELAECPKCGHTAARLSDAGALYCPACGVVTPSEAAWSPSPCPRCGMDAFPISRDGALYCPACGAVFQPKRAA